MSCMYLNSFKVFLTKNKSRRSIHRKIVKFSNSFLTQQTFSLDGRQYSGQCSLIEINKSSLIFIINITVLSFDLTGIYVKTKTRFISESN